MTAPPRLRRRELTSLLAVSGGVLLAGGCGGPAPVATSTDVPRDPLAELDETHWDARSVQELRALPVQGTAAELSSWADLGGDDSFLDPARDLLVGFLEAAYLSPAVLRELDDEAAHDHVAAACPDFWQDDLRAAWDGGNRAYYAVDPAEPYRTVGRPAIAADWSRAERDGTPVLALGTTIAWTVLDAATRAVGVIAYQLGVVADIGEDGGVPTAAVRVTVHGLDGCAIVDADGLLVPTLADDEKHRSAQEATWDGVLASPRIPLEDVLDPESTFFERDMRTHVTCS